MKRYKAIAFEFDDSEGTGVALDIIEHEEGEYVKYDDIKYLLKTASSNSEYVKCPCCDEPWNIMENDSCKCGAFIAKRA